MASFAPTCRVAVQLTGAALPPLSAGASLPVRQPPQRLPRQLLASGARNLRTAVAAVGCARSRTVFSSQPSTLSLRSRRILDSSAFLGDGANRIRHKAPPLRTFKIHSPHSDTISAGLKNLSEALELLLTSVVVIPVFKSLKISPVLGFILAGLLLGPHGENLLHDYRDINSFAEFGVLFLLFEMGLELSIDRLKKLGATVFGLGTAQMAFTTAAIAGLTKLIGGNAVSDVEALVIGNALSLSSSAFVLQLLRERGELGGDFGQASFAVLLFQDIAVIPLLVVLPLLGTADLSHGLAVATSLGLPALKAFGALIGVILAGHLGLGRVFQIVSASKSPDAFVAAILLTVLGMGYLTEFIGLSDTLGAFLAGVLLAETQFRHQIEADISPARGLLLALFFMTVGFNVDLQFALERAPLVAALIAGLIAVKATITAGLAKTAAGLRTGPAIRTGLLISQGGEFSFVVFALARQLGILPEDVNNLLIVVVALSMALTPTLANAGAAISRSLEQQGSPPPGPAAVKVDDNSTVICGFGPVGQTVGRILTESQRAWLAVEVDPSVVRQARASGLPVLFGDLERPQVLAAAGVRRPAAVVVTMRSYKRTLRMCTALRTAYPGVPIFVRARTRRQQRELEAAGATTCVPELLEGSLQLGSAVLEADGAAPELVQGILSARREQEGLHSRPGARPYLKPEPGVTPGPPLEAEEDITEDWGEDGRSPSPPEAAAAEARRTLEGAVNHLVPGPRPSKNPNPPPA